MIAEQRIWEHLTGFMQSPQVLSCGLCSAVIRLGVLFYMVLYLSMMALGSLPVWRQEGILFARCPPALDWRPAVAQGFSLQACCCLHWSFAPGVPIDCSGALNIDVCFTLFSGGGLRHASIAAAPCGFIHLHSM